MWKAVFVFCVILCSQCGCLDGADTPSSVGPRIVGGVATTIEKFPFAAQIIASNQVFCGGSLVSRRHVLTAAHCIVNDYNVIINPRLLTVRVGTANANRGGTSNRVSAIIKHEFYDIRSSHQHDIAILLLPKNLSLGSRVALISLAPSGYVLTNTSMVTAVGWGTMSNNLLADVLQEVTVPIVNQTTCARSYLTQHQYVTDNMICAGRLGVGGQDACQGDSGGPLVHGSLLVGVTSWGIYCGHPDFPGVYARVASYNYWIQDTIRRSSAVPEHIGITSLLLPVIMSLINHKL